MNIHTPQPKTIALSARYQRLLDLADGTRDAREIGASLGWTVKTVHEYAARLRRMGHYPRFRRSGNFSGLQFVQCLPNDVQAWIARQVPEGCTPGDLLRAIIIDAYQAEQDAA